MVFVPSTNIEQAGFMNDTAASHHGTIKTLWFHFTGVVMSFRFLYTVYVYVIYHYDM